MTDLNTIIQIIEDGEFEHYGLRAHRGSAVVGETLGKSFVWVDGECTDEELPGISTLRVTDSSEVAQLIGFLKDTYCWDNESIVLVGGYTGEHGEDDGEFIIADNVCLAVLEG